MSSTKSLWKFNWIGGGYNQVYANTKKAALAEIESRFGTCNLKLNPSTLTKVKDERAFWANYPRFD